MSDSPQTQQQHPEAFLYQAGFGLVSKQSGAPAVDGDLFMRGQDVAMLMHRQGEVIDAMEKVIADLKRQLNSLQADRDEQYDMKVRAREQRDRVTMRLAERNAGPVDQGEPDVMVRIVHKDGEVLDTEVLATSQAFDNLPAGEVALFLSAGK